MYQLTMSPAVRSALGPAGIHRVQTTGPKPDTACPPCGRPIGAAGPVNVVVIRQATTDIVAWSHPGCWPSGVYQVPDTDAADTRITFTMYPLLVGSGAGAVAALFAIPDTQLYAARAGETVNLLISNLLRVGWVLNGVADPPLLDRWAAELTSTGLTVTDADGSPFYQGSLDGTPPGWTDVARRCGWALLFVGGQSSGEDAVTILRAASAAGTLAAARIPLRITARTHHPVRRIR